MPDGVCNWADENVADRVANCDPVFVPPIFFDLKISRLQNGRNKNGISFLRASATDSSPQADAPFFLYIWQFSRENFIIFQYNKKHLKHKKKFVSSYTIYVNLKSLTRQEMSGNSIYKKTTHHICHSCVNSNISYYLINVLYPNFCENDMMGYFCNWYNFFEPLTFNFSL